eukprot:4160383-Pleurochrysis_carterae.AAC.1
MPPPSDEDAATQPSSAASPEQQDAEQPLPPSHEHFRRGLGAYPLRNRTPAVLFTARTSRRPHCWER